MEQFDTNRVPIETIPKPIKWIIPESVRTTYATHLIVQQQGSVFRLLFFDAELPIVAGTPEEQIQAYRDLSEVNAKCVAKVVITADNIGQAVSGLLESLNQFNAMLRATQEKGLENARSSEQTELPATG